MANEILQKRGTPIVWVHAADYSDPSGGNLSGTDELDLTSLAAGSARQGDKVDLGATRSALYTLMVAIEFDIAPSSGDVIDFYLAFSPSATAANCNPGGVSGSDAAYTGTAGDSLDDSLKQLLFVGSLVATSDAAPLVQYQVVGVVAPPERYVSVVVDNNADQALEGDAVEMYVALVPITDELQ